MTSISNNKVPAQILNLDQYLIENRRFKNGEYAPSQSLFFVDTIANFETHFTSNKFQFFEDINYNSINLVSNRSRTNFKFNYSHHLLRNWSFHCSNVTIAHFETHFTSIKFNFCEDINYNSMNLMPNRCLNSIIFSICCEIVVGKSKKLFKRYSRPLWNSFHLERIQFSPSFQL